MMKGELVVVTCGGFALPRTPGDKPRRAPGSLEQFFCDTPVGGLGARVVFFFCKEDFDILPSAWPGLVPSGNTPSGLSSLIRHLGF